MAILQFSEVQGYPLERRTKKGFEATRQIQCAWDDRYDIRQLLIQHPGQTYPYIPQFGARVVSVGMSPIPNAQALPDPISPTLNRYEDCYLTVLYASVHNDDPQPYPRNLDPAKNENPLYSLSETLEPYTETIKLSHTLFKWSNNKPLTKDEAPVRVMTRMKYVITRHNQTGVPPDLSQYVGKINSQPLQTVLIGQTFAVHTARFEPPTLTVQADDEGRPIWDVTYRFQIKETSWRLFWNADSGQEEQILKKSNNQPYAFPAEIDFGPLLPQTA